MQVMRLRILDTANIAAATSAADATSLLRSRKLVTWYYGFVAEDPYSFVKPPRSEMM